MQKKWFIYVQDHHEGPFNLNEVHEKQISNIVTDDTFVWCEGMGDWQPLPQVPELYRELKNKSQPLQEKTEGTQPSVATGPTLIKPAGQYTAAKAKSNSKVPLIGGVILVPVLGIGAFVGLSHFASEELHSKLRPTFSKILTKAPFLSPLIKVVPALPDLKGSDLKELEGAMISPIDQGVKIAFALSTADPKRPFFYVSSNLPSGTKLDVNIIGNGETLLNSLQFFGQNSTILNAGLGKTEVFLSDGASSIPEGEYSVYVSESSEQEESIKGGLSTLAPVKPSVIAPQVAKGAHFVFTKTYFLGGEKDQNYATRLKAFHEKIKSDAEKELQELKQYADILSDQFSRLPESFERIYRAKKIKSAMKASWQKDMTQWQQLSGQMDERMQAWTKETIQANYFYGKLYEIIKGTTESFKKYFDLLNNYVEKPSDKNAFEIQKGKAYSEAKEALDILQTKVNMMINAPKTATGLPTKEGL